MKYTKSGTDKSGLDKDQTIDPREIARIASNAIRDEDAGAVSELVSLSKNKAYSKLISQLPDRAKLRSLLSSDSPKMRKNIARLFGSLGHKSDLCSLLDALENETTLFVIPSLILAIGSCSQNAESDQRIIAGQAVSKQLESANQSHPPEDLKHTKEISHACRTVLAGMESGRSELKGDLPPLNIHLRTADNCGKILVDEANEKKLAPSKIHGDTLLYSNADYLSILNLRCFEEALIPIGWTSIPHPDSNKTDIEEWADKTFAQASSIQSFLSKYYKKPPIPYRIEIKGVSHTLRSACAKALASRLDAQGLLINSPGSYIAECRLECVDDRMRIYLKLFEPKDSRFDYREVSLPASIRPATAAILARFARSHSSNAANPRVLDLCCGSATLLIERAIISDSGYFLGVDISAQAVSAARKNITAFKSSQKNIRTFEAAQKNATTFEVGQKNIEAFEVSQNNVGAYETVRNNIEAFKVKASQKNATTFEIGQNNVGANEAAQKNNEAFEVEAAQKNVAAFKSTHQNTQTKENQNNPQESQKHMDDRKLEIIGGDATNFSPKQRFDEIITNLPFGVRVNDSKANSSLYSSLISRLDTLLNPNGIALFYTTQRSTLERLTSRSNWKIVDSIRFQSGGLQPWGLLLKRR